MSDDAPVPGPLPLNESDARTWAMLAWVGSLLVGFLAPLIIMLTVGTRSRLVRDQAVESLNFAITCAIAMIVSLILTVVIVGFLLLPVVAVGSLVFAVIGAVKAYQGVEYRVPVNIRLVR